ncbi:hypothetical protein EDD18DRAFT_1143309 [Armillaria luteobubalina]|uniref:Uncharacterized protein n=1 Tax=Armillaria luteobubalina TaxID=153913 RepID=A0AA39QH47_9AGAR|nr:hypothetical protein EDD18DRAFT_1143309 [Armillaria luteobubalina]
MEGDRQSRRIADSLMLTTTLTTMSLLVCLSFLLTSPLRSRSSSRAYSVYGGSHALLAGNYLQVAPAKMEAKRQEQRRNPDTLWTPVKSVGLKKFSAHFAVVKDLCVKNLCGITRFPWFFWLLQHSPAVYQERYSSTLARLTVWMDLCTASFFC